ncbi:ABC transporter substrate-binding protein [Alicyclobacillus sp.]|uniref:ABC transporter substrate-binding protein n=1 Tax=Alicyclobacillus sp. TaxID=61169 RepID=UPI0025BAC7CD|nr:ABC transporter substrate-binding protein [Alicyclobacillus sp.]MCL6516074.1 ABC transporter substrate-binding protein [Alicyclobacillus sp.]
MRWRTWGTSLAAIALMAGVTACGSGNQPTSAAPAGAAAAGGGGGVIKIGMETGLTGSDALNGKFERDGAQLAIDQINAQGGIHGKKLELVVEDDQGTNQSGVAAIQKLFSDPQIPVVIGSIKSTIVQATEPYIQRAQVPTLIGGTSPKLTQAGNPWVFRFRPNDNYASAVMADWIVNTMKLKKVAIIHDTDDFGTAGNQLLKDKLEKLGATVVADEGYQTSTKDFTPFLEHVANAKPEVVALYMTNAEDAAQLLRQYRQLGFKMPVVGSPAVASQISIKLGGSAIDGVYGVQDFSPDANDAAKAFAKLWEQKYNEPPDQHSAWPFDAVNILAQVMNQYGTSPDQIRQGLLNIHDYHGAEGVYNFDSHGDGLHGYNVVQVKDGKIVEIKYVDLSNQS